MSQFNKEFVIQDYLNMFKKYKWWIVIAMILTATVFGGFKYLTYQPTYNAHTTLLVTSTSLEGDSDDTSDRKTSSDYNVSSNVLMTFTEVINSQTLRTRVQEELDNDNLGSITVVNNGGSVIRINVTHTDPMMAAIIANMTAEVFTDIIQTMMSDINMQVLDVAAIPQYTEGMGLPKVILIGALVGFVVVVGVILLKEMLDNTLRLPKDVEKEIQIPILGAIPDAELEIKQYMKKGKRG